MKLLVWDESYSVKVHLIDGQHKKLFNLTNSYAEALQNGMSKAALSKLLDGLVEYANIHFSTEERYFVQFNYDLADEHKREHAILTAKIEDLKSKVRTGITIKEDEVSNFLKIWLENHVKGTDRKYMDCFYNNGLR
jgi:hemerythrin-like metal-binding protein